MGSAQICGTQGAEFESPSGSQSLYKRLKTVVGRVGKKRRIVSEKASAATSMAKRGKKSVGRVGKSVGNAS